MITTEETVTITKKRYEDLLEAEDWLGWLEAAGVDNSCAWEYAADLRREHLKENGETE